ncbi:MAG: cystathionine beta-lyase [Alphaproteobacteria bacterium]|nr:cystathionine beta-lyase [Alphaproteobacteria bacterium]MBU0797979.1 cystathionine beta-lyase [Alphaproteobacteria bacterium]MBU0887949.1 cystathionine beta-lyase [Alphaproteobacteria bacterium]MBU1814828.1 cystathionine beta-lyase [Alphaproteobacteria bacterium]MBU2090793.1 cystathionine beta-lyase [Alphaproteobacteria bacterium]
MKKNGSKETLLAHLGRSVAKRERIINTPVYHASTITYADVEDWENRHKNLYSEMVYGRFGTPTSFALQEAMSEIEGGDRALLYPSGAAAVSAAILAFVKTGDHILVCDVVYAPTRKFCDGLLRDMGVETTYFAPGIGAGIGDLIRPNTKLVYVESPGTHTFEIQDIPAIAAEAHKAGCVILHDNTWATPLFFDSFNKGVDISIHAATKYVVGHSDAMLGVVVMKEPHFAAVSAVTAMLGYCVGPDDVYLGLRGLRTMSVRLKQHHQNGLAVANWLESRPEVSRVLHPGLPSNPHHALWKRDFTGASGLFGVVLNDVPKPAVAALINELELFSIGASWGGYESLVTTCYPPRTAEPWNPEGPLLRLHIGLEDPADIIADLEAGFDRLNRARKAA